MNRRTLLRTGALLPATLALPSLARAQDAWPSRPVTIVVPFAPGSSSDIVARAMAAGMQQSLGKPVVAENRPGATGELGTRVVVRSASHDSAMRASSSGLRSP